MEKAQDIPMEQRTPKVDPYKRFPGNIKYQTNIGCKAVQFLTDGDSSAAQKMNDYFTKNNGAVITFLSGDADSLLCLYTIQLTDEEMEIITTRAEIVEKMVAEAREKREAEQREAEEKREADERERVRLVQKGKKCEHDHGGLDKVKEENTRMKKLLRKHKLLTEGEDEQP